MRTSTYTYITYAYYKIVQNSKVLLIVSYIFKKYTQNSSRYAILFISSFLSLWILLCMYNKLRTASSTSTYLQYETTRIRWDSALRCRRRPKNLHNNTGSFNELPDNFYIDERSCAQVLVIVERTFTSPFLLLLLLLMIFFHFILR